MLQVLSRQVILVNPSHWRTDRLRVARLKGQHFGLQSSVTRTSKKGKNPLKILGRKIFGGPVKKMAWGLALGTLGMASALLSAGLLSGLAVLPLVPGLFLTAWGLFQGLQRLGGLQDPSLLEQRQHLVAITMEPGLEPAQQKAQMSQRRDLLLDWMRENPDAVKLKPQQLREHMDWLYRFLDESRARDGQISFLKTHLRDYLEDAVKVSNPSLELSHLVSSNEGVVSHFSFEDVLPILSAMAEAVSSSKRVPTYA